MLKRLVPHLAPEDGHPNELIRDEQRLFDILGKLAMEDPTFVIERHPTSNETVIRGLGEIHLKAKLAKMAKQYLAAPASTAGVERVFSAAGRMHTDLRKSMKDSTIEHSLFASFNTL